MKMLIDEARRLESLAFQLNELLSTKTTKLPQAALEDLSNSLAEIIGRLTPPIMNFVQRGAKGSFVPSSGLIDLLTAAAHPHGSLSIYTELDIMRAIGRLLREIAVSRRRADHRVVNKLLSLVRSADDELAAYVQQLTERRLDQDHLWVAESAVMPYSAHDVMPLKDAGLLILVDSPGLSFETSAPHIGPGESPADIAVDVYLDIDDDQEINEILGRVDDLTRELGYKQVGDIEVKRGSIFRRSRAAADQVTDELKSRLIKVERAFELAQLELRQADVDSREADAVNRLLGSLDRVPRACLRVGSVFIIKYPYPATGEPVVIVRNLSQLELHALDRFPEIQRTPETALQALAMTLESIVSEGKQFGDSDSGFPPAIQD